MCRGRPQYRAKLVSVSHAPFFVAGAGGVGGPSSTGAAGVDAAASVGKIRGVATESASDAAGRKGNTSTLAGSAPTGPVMGGNFVARKSYLIKWQGLPYVVRGRWGGAATSWLLLGCGRWMQMLHCCCMRAKHAAAVLLLHPLCPACLLVFGAEDNSLEGCPLSP